MFVYLKDCYKQLQATCQVANFHIYPQSSIADILHELAYLGVGMLPQVYFKYIVGMVGP